MAQSSGTSEHEPMSAEAAPHTPDEEMHPVHFPQTQKFSLDPTYDYLREGWPQRLGYRAIRCFAHVVLPLYTVFALGVRVHGLSNLRRAGRGGLVLASNHVHYLDCALIDCLFWSFGRRAYYATLENNFKIPIARHLIRWLGGVPIPQSPHRMVRFLEEMERALQSGDCVSVYPEGILRPYAEQLHTIRRGAFQLAVRAGVPLLPICITFRESRGLHRLLRQKPLIDVRVLEPLQADPSRPQREEIDRLMTAYRRSMQSCMEEIYSQSAADPQAEEAL